MTTSTAQTPIVYTMLAPKMKEVRCTCGKLLARVEVGRGEVKCKCGNTKSFDIK